MRKSPRIRKPRRSEVSLWNREYETRELSADGDTVDVRHFATEASAVKRARELVRSGVSAAVVEHHVTRYASAGSDRQETYASIVAFGDADAIQGFGWDGRVEK